MKDYYNFSYKSMDETVDPWQDDCPESILKLLDDTDSEWALDWRERCRKKNAFKSALKRLPVGSKIVFKAKFNMSNGTKPGDEIVLEKMLVIRNGSKRQYWFDGIHCWNSKYTSKEYKTIDVS